MKITQSLDSRVLSWSGVVVAFFITTSLASGARRIAVAERAFRQGTAVGEVADPPHRTPAPAGLREAGSRR